MFGFIKQIFLTVMTFFSCNALKNISMKNQECKIKPYIISTPINLHFILTVFLQINAVVAVIILMTHMQNYVFLILLKSGKS